MLNGLKVFVDAVEKKEIVVSKSKSYYNVSSKVKNIKLLKAKLEFFMLLALELKPFLKEFQSNKPMVPYLYTRLHSFIDDVAE